MKSILFLIALLVSATSNAAEFKCIQTSTLLLEGMPFYLFFEISTDSTDETKLDEVIFESLAENGFYSKYEIPLVSGSFIENQSLNFEVIFSVGEPDKNGTLNAVYNPVTENYIGTLNFANAPDTVAMKCMHLSAF